MGVAATMKVLSTILGIILIPFLCSDYATAQDEEKKLKPLQRADADSDGEVTMEELKTFLTENHFDEWKEKVDLGIDDEDADFENDEAMEKLFTDKYLDRWAKKIDANQNEVISKWELRLASKALDQVLLEVEETAEAKAESEERRMPATAIERMDENFRTQKPVVGTAVEDLVALNESGAEVDFEKLRGKHVVIVFGCLT